jgi:hypothetical protein
MGANVNQTKACVRSVFRFASRAETKKFNPVMKNLQHDRAVSAQYRWCKVLHKLVPQLLKKNEFIGIGLFRNWYRVLQKLIW